jgi:hypothetical protein
MQRNWLGRLWDRVIIRSGHRQIGPATVYAFDTAMHGAVNVRTRRWGTICLAWPRLGGVRGFAAYAYLSPNATPWAATLLWGREFTGDERRMAQVRRHLWGHGYDSERLDPQMLDRAVWAVNERDDDALARFVALFRDRAEWVR